MPDSTPDSAVSDQPSQPSRVGGVLTGLYRLAVLACLVTACVLLARGNGPAKPSAPASAGSARALADASADLFDYLDARLDRLEVRVVNLPTLATGALAVELESPPIVEVANMPDFLLEEVAVKVRSMPAVEVANMPDLDRAAYPVRVTNMPMLDAGNFRVEVTNMPLIGFDTIPVRVTNFPQRFD